MEYSLTELVLKVVRWQPYAAIYRSASGAVNQSFSTMLHLWLSIINPEQHMAEARRHCCQWSCRRRRSYCQPSATPHIPAGVPSSIGSCARRGGASAAAPARGLWGALPRGYHWKPRPPSLAADSIMPSPVQSMTVMTVPRL